MRSDKDGKKSFISNIQGMIKCVFSNAILNLIIRLAAWVLVLTYFCYRTNLWEYDPAFVKITLVFFITAIFIVGKSITEYTPNFYIKLISGLIGFDIITTFLLNYLSTNFGITLFLLFSTFTLSITYEVNKWQNISPKLNRPLEICQSFLGLVFLCLAISNIIKNIDLILTLRTLKMISLPIIYTITSIPYFKLEQTCSFYENIFIHFDNKYFKNFFTKLYLKVKIILYCKLDKEKIELIQSYYFENRMEKMDLKETRKLYTNFICVNAPPLRVNA